jgi:hypothetical protein
MIYRIGAFFIITLAIFIPTSSWMTYLKWGIVAIIIFFFAHMHDLEEQRRYNKRTPEVID